MSLTPSRRALLQATALVPALLTETAACTSHRPAHAVVDPDVAVRAAAVAREVELLSAYDEALAAAAPGASAELAAVRADHEAHLAALGAPSPAASPSASAQVPASPGALAARERSAAAAHAADALRASRPLAALLASMAASEASHLVALT
jgi:hypothetical protein